MPTKTTRRQRTRPRAGSRTRAAAAPPDSSWMSQGACADRGDLAWLADADTLPTRQRLVMAAVCAGCPVLTDCARYATEQEMTGGFWAGISRDLDTSAVFPSRAWTTQRLPGLETLPVTSCSGGAA